MHPFHILIWHPLAVKTVTKNVDYFDYFPTSKIPDMQVTISGHNSTNKLVSEPIKGMVLLYETGLKCSFCLDKRAKQSSNK